ncbi:Glyoxalase/bleomycin resistance protein/dioxygenase [Catenulispora acidiphila DSM 44928]|uniref:Glyoxalase/bleomycin resistance protein/dioxygenase n=1 Tax=Catenulispora acidiphila (strain DSM 44928 / JCM 14897 / NBRC 102108 / NRRL B-24433 / ID139908) TaxID=479433 RepID=C7QGU7_CATAD|nr:VOC family protein [Catenulispora acidiphila]ACU76797.1 Glyoxalase/bleomycin resistance protein/dioxygenase [Catenulispora acidiphila DSM 44928]
MITSENTSNLPGWIDLGSPDAGASAEFYGQVFGWTAENLMPESADGPGYWSLKKDGKQVAGLGGLTDPSARPDWMTYIRVADANATVAAAESNGAKVRVPVTEVPGEGSMAQLTDPSGAEFALWQSGGTTGFEACCVEDTMLWAELWTRDPAAAKSFYPALFGWQVEPYMEGAPESGGYDMWTMQPGDPLAAFGGIMTITDQVPIQDEKWIPYFMVADADRTVERVSAAGGAVLIPAADAPPGRLAALADQFGARFNILQPAPMG